MDQIPDKYLVDYNWQLKYIMGSSTMNTLDKPVAKITFTLGEKESHILHNIDLEFDKMELKDLIKILENVTKVDE